MTKSEEINQILHKHIRLVFKDAINYKELIQALINWNEKQLLLHNVSQQRELLIAFLENYTNYKNNTHEGSEEEIVDEYLSNL